MHKRRTATATRRTATARRIKPIPRGSIVRVRRRRATATRI